MGAELKPPSAFGRSAPRERRGLSFSCAFLISQNKVRVTYVAHNHGMRVQLSLLQPFPYLGRVNIWKTSLTRESHSFVGGFFFFYLTRRVTMCYNRKKRVARKEGNMREYIDKQELLDYLESVDGCLADGTVTPQTLYAQIMSDIRQFSGVKGDLSYGGTMVKVDGNEVGLWDGFAYVICDNKGKSICVTAMGDENDKFVSLNDLLKDIGYDKEIDSSVIVIIEDFLEGKVYRYNNYGDYSWYECGETRGFA